MATASKQNAVVACTGCNAMIVAERREDGSFTPLGSEEDCVCGASSFRRLR